MPERVDIGKHFFSAIFTPMARSEYEVESPDELETRPLESNRLKKEGFLKIMQCMDNIKIRAENLEIREGREIVKMKTNANRLKELSQTVREALWASSKNPEVLLEFVYARQGRKIIVNSDISKLIFSINYEREDVVQGPLDDKVVLQDAILIASVGESQVF